MAATPELILWGVIASPYLLKMQALAEFNDLEWRRWPDQAGYGQALRAAAHLRRGRRRESIDRYPRRVPGMDEYPAVPYYGFDGRRYFYDSTGLARHLDGLGVSEAPLIPGEPSLRFLCMLIDEAFDEFGLYMAHHNRWVTSAATNVMGEMTSRELRKLIPPGMRRRFARKLAERQVRRCPYLFSVAPPGFDARVAPSLTPPSRHGFPPTHELLDDAWRRFLAAKERLLEAQPYLLGERFTLADASAYGQLGMNLVDGRAAELLESLAPRTFRWLCAIRDGQHRGSRGELSLSDRLSNLLQVIGDTFVPLMDQNARAWAAHAAAGQTVFNEAAFDRGEALYDGELLGRPFRAVAKSFQVVVWRELSSEWGALAPSQVRDLQNRYPALARVATSFEGRSATWHR